MLRPARSSDLAFVRDSWFASFRDSPLARSLSPQVYRARWGALLDDLATVDRVRVYADDVSPDVIVGWVCTDGQTLHFAFTREGFRQQGVLRALLEGLHVKHYTHRTTDWQRVLPHLSNSWTYDPAIAWSHFNREREFAGATP